MLFNLFFNIVHITEVSFFHFRNKEPNLIKQQEIRTIELIYEDKLQYAEKLQ